jgi:glutathione S-transferase
VVEEEVKEEEEVQVAEVVEEPQQDVYKHTYFALYAKGEFVRIALVIAKAKWEDVAIQLGPEWKKIKSNYPNGFLPVLQINDGAMMDQTRALTRFVCEQHGIKCDNPFDNLKSENIIECITDDCKAYKPDGLFLGDEEKVAAYYYEHAKKVIPGFLARLNRNCSASIEKHGWAATAKMSPADVFLLAWISKNVFNPFRTELTEPMLKKFPVLHGYWEKHKHLVTDYMENRRAKYI